MEKKHIAILSGLPLELVPRRSSLISFWYLAFVCRCSSLLCTAFSALRKAGANSSLCKARSDAVG